MIARNLKLIWYFWRLSYASIAFMLFLSLGSIYLLVMFNRPELPSSISYFDLLCQVFWIGGLGSCSFMQGSGKGFLPPPFLFTIPMSTKRYLVLYYGYFMTVTFAVATLASFLHLHYFGYRIEGLLHTVTIQWWNIPLVCVTLACSIQSLYHLSGIKNELRIIPMAATLIILGFGSSIWLLDVKGPGAYNKYLPYIGIAFAALCSYHSLRAYRHHKQGESIAELLSRLNWGKGRTEPFASPKKALFWLGWRRHARTYVVFTLIVSVIILIAGSKSKEIDLYAFAYLESVAILFSSLLYTFLFIVMDSYDVWGKSHGYFMTLPARTTDIARGRIDAMTCGYSLLISICILCPVLLGTAWYYYVGYLPSSISHQAIFALYILLMMSWLAIWFSALAMLEYCICCIVAVIWQILYRSTPPDLLYVLVSVPFVIPIIVHTIKSAHSRKFIDPVNRKWMLISLLPLLPYLFFKNTHTPLFLLFFAFLCILVPLPFLAVPVYLDKFRHR